MWLSEQGLNSVLLLLSHMVGKPLNTNSSPFFLLLSFPIFSSGKCLNCNVGPVSRAVIPHPASRGQPHLEGVVAGQKEPVVFSMAVGSEGTKVPPAFHLHYGILDRLTIPVQNLALHTCSSNTHTQHTHTVCYTARHKHIVLTS